MNKALYATGTALVAAAAFPVATLVILGSLTVLIVYDVSVAIVALIAVGLLYAMGNIWLRPIMRWGRAVRRRWTKICFEAWKLFYQRRTVRQSEARMQASVYDSTMDRDLGGDRDA